MRTANSFWLSPLSSNCSLIVAPGGVAIKLRLFTIVIPPLIKWKFNDNLQFPLRLQFEFYLLFSQKSVDKDGLNPLRIDLCDFLSMDDIFQYGIEPSLQQYRMHLFHLYADGFFSAISEPYFFSASLAIVHTFSILRVLYVIFNPSPLS